LGTALPPGTQKALPLDIIALTSADLMLPEPFLLAGTVAAHLKAGEQNRIAHGSVWRHGLLRPRIEREKAQDGFWLGSVIVNQNKGPRNSTRRMLPRGLLEKQIKSLAPAVESVPVVRLR
jgi:hypothetical protein